MLAVLIVPALPTESPLRRLSDEVPPSSGGGTLILNGNGAGTLTPAPTARSGVRIVLAADSVIGTPYSSSSSSSSSSSASSAALTKMGGGD